jgi:hypothetical protein
VAGVIVHHPSGNPRTPRSKLSTTSDWLRISPRIVTCAPGSTSAATAPPDALSPSGRRSVSAASPRPASVTAAGASVALGSATLRAPGESVTSTFSARSATTTEPAAGGDTERTCPVGSQRTYSPQTQKSTSSGFCRPQAPQVLMCRLQSCRMRRAASRATALARVERPHAQPVRDVGRLGPFDQPRHGGLSVLCERHVAVDDE